MCGIYSSVQFLLLFYSILSIGRVLKYCSEKNIDPGKYFTVYLTSMLDIIIATTIQIPTTDAKPPQLSINSASANNNMQLQKALVDSVCCYVNCSKRGIRRYHSSNKNILVCYYSRYSLFLHLLLLLKRNLANLGALLTHHVMRSTKKLFRLPLINTKEKGITCVEAV